MKRVIYILILLPIFSFSQEWNSRSNSSEGLKGVSVGLLFQGQTKYPKPYLGPEVGGIYNDGAYHFIVDVYYNRFIIGFQLSDEFLYLEKIDNGAVWKPRGFNGSYSSLTRAYWFTLGYNIIDYSNINVKLGVGYRSGPKESFTNNNYTAAQVADGYDYSNPESIFNASQLLINNFSEIDFSLSITYPIKIYRKFGIVPELGYTIKHGGLLTGISIIY
ncbi:MAG: hypothetical protein ACKVJR_08730 [Flavobacteriales bacterium]|jgi:hypothetical protein|tara:strand:+ start:545 stop:1198 length:654 start_codon:yes stop_codon:yes gene_type:complete